MKGKTFMASLLPEQPESRLNRRQMTNPRYDRGSIPLGAKDREKNPKEAKGDLRQAITLFFLLPKPAS